MAFIYENFVQGSNFDVDIITDTLSNDRLLFIRGWHAWLSNILWLFITGLLHYTPCCRVNMASEGATTSPPALAGSSFSIENLLNLSEGATEKPTAKRSTGTCSSTCNSLRRPPFPLVPQAVRPFAHHGHNLPLCTPEPGFNFGGIPHPRTDPSIHHFPIPNNGPPLGKLKRGVKSVNTCPCCIVAVAQKLRLVATSLHFILHRVNGWKLWHILSHKLIVLFVNGLRWDVLTTFVYFIILWPC